jgi:flagellar hook-length control protein FliK
LLSPQAAHAVQTFVSIGSPSSALERAPAEGTAVVSLPNETAVVSSIVQSMRLQATSGGGTAIVTLDPGYLGDVSIALQVQHGMVTATVHAANGDVREWLQANEAVLGRGLAAHGLSLDRLVVADARTAEEAEADGRRQPPQQGQEQETPRHTPRRAAAGTFEVVV